MLNRADIRHFQNREYREAMAKWLESEPWDYFATFTAPYEMNLKTSRKLMERYLDKLGSDSIMFWVAERHKEKPGYHTHGLIKSKWPKEDLWELWQICSVHKGQKSFRNDGHIFNRCDISPRDYKKKMGEYVSKYITKSYVDWGV